MGPAKDIEDQLSPENRAPFRLIVIVVLVCTGLVGLGFRIMVWAKEYVTEVSQDANALGAQASKQVHADHDRQITELQGEFSDLRARAERASDRITRLEYDVRTILERQRRTE